MKSRLFAIFENSLAEKFDPAQGTEDYAWYAGAYIAKHPEEDLDGSWSNNDDWHYYADLVGTKLGEGAARRVWTARNNPDYVIKTAKGHGNAGDNQNEYEEWLYWKATKFKKFFAPVIAKSDCDHFLVMERAEPLKKGEAPNDGIPVFMSFMDFQSENFGRLKDGRLVMIDYAFDGEHRLEHYDPEQLKKATAIVPFASFFK